MSLLGTDTAHFSAAGAGQVFVAVDDVESLGTLVTRAPGNVGRSFYKTV
jgi:hypothetical protein